MSKIKNFKLSVSDQDLKDLHSRLSNTRWPNKETVKDWNQGIPLSYMKEICAYWLEEYNWRDREKKLNKFPHFITRLNDIDIHFIHKKSPHKEAKPLIITHGWPGSFVEFLKVIEPLTDPTNFGGKAEDSFHVVIPSLPGFDFSGKPETTGWGVEKIADTWSQLMSLLGYKNYFAQGGDWGAIVTTHIGLQDQKNCKGIHLNMVVVSPDPETMQDLTKFEENALASMGFYQEWDSGYSKQQSTRPQTIGYSLVDSPIGQAAWILEKFYQWTDCDGHPENVLSKDELLDNVMMYWLTQSAASSARLYWESFGNPSQEIVNIPTGCSIYPKEIFRSSERWIKKRFPDLRYYNVLAKGGHFAAFEKPEIYVEEVRKFCKEIE